MDYNWNELGLHIPQIMLPKEGTDYSRWAVIACDQFTSDPAYWEQVQEIVGDAPSTLRLMLPEYYLGKPEEETLIREARENMKKYVEEGILRTLEPGCMLVRRTAEGRSRLGLVICIDLEAYDFHQGSQSLIRATERTIVERIPPRLRIRRGAPLEMPHILILIDDPDKTVLEPLEALDGEVLYDTDLMLNGGHITGKFLPEASLEGARAAMSALMDKGKAFYGEGKVLLEAMGDGNHSLATAKTAWEELKETLSPEEQESHPARFALCEIENVHDEGIVFEPIHRVVFGHDKITGAAFLEKLVAVLDEQNGSAHTAPAGTAQADNTYVIPYVTGSEEGCIVIENPVSGLEVGALQNGLDALLKDVDAELDFIHGEASVRTLSEDPANVGFLLPSMDKFKLFPAVAQDGALPRKTFSMGEANEKRYYIEVHSLED